MKHNSIYLNEKSEEAMLAFYDRQMDNLGIAFEEITLPTRYGATHLVVTGPQEAMPLITLHGGNGNTPLNLSLFLPLTKKYRVYAPDTIGQPGKSAQRRISTKDNSLGHWVIDILDALKMDQAAFVTSSYSAGILLQLACIAPERISRAALHVPSGIAHGSLVPIVTKLMLPWMMYRVRPSQARLQKAFLPMMTELNEEFLAYTDMMLRHYKMVMEPPREIKEEEIERFQMPVLVIAAKEDIFFPASKVIPRSKRLFGNLEVEEIEGNHLSSRKTLEHVNWRIDRFLMG
jgi:pimeloyl-ACP methyl ester carboxylesterase